MNQNELKIKELITQIENLKSANLLLIEEKYAAEEKFRQQGAMMEMVTDLIDEQNKENAEYKKNSDEKFRQQTGMHHLAIDFVFEQNKELESIISKLKEIKV